jgi:dTDP-4-dehydrorhamnose 3,5-epimerase
MEFSPTRFSGAWLITPKVHADGRGFFLEHFSRKAFLEHGITREFVQDNHSKSTEKGVLRGLHFQLPPCEQAKLVRVISGSIFDVIVDLRQGLSTYGSWEGFTLSASNFKMLYIPGGFAHGFCTLEPNSEVLYKVDNYYSAAHDSGIIWNDASLNIAWPCQAPVLSEKDKKLGILADFNSPFRFA